MIINCLSCKYINFPLTNELEENGYAINILGMKEDIVSFTCQKCRDKNLLQSNILSNNYELNIKIWQKLHYEIFYIPFNKKMTEEDLKGLNLDLIFYKIDFLKVKNEITNLGIYNFPNEKGIYIPIFRDKNKKFNKLNTFIFESKQIEFSSDSKLILAKK